MALLVAMVSKGETWALVPLWAGMIFIVGGCLWKAAAELCKTADALVKVSSELAALSLRDLEDTFVLLKK